MFKYFLYFVSCVLLAFKLQSASLYDNNGQTIDFNARVKVKASGDKHEGMKSQDGGSRITLSGTRDLNDTVQAFGIIEYSVNGQVTSGTQNVPFGLRLANFGFDFGSNHTVRLGQLWSSFSDVVGYTDVFEEYGAESTFAYSFESGTLFGTGRANKAVDYQYDNGSLRLGVTMQGFDSEHSATRELSNRRDYSIGGKVEYTFSGIKAGAALQYANTLTPEDEKKVAEHYKKDPLFAILGLSYKNDLVYLAATTSFTKNVYKAVDTVGFEVFTGYFYDQRDTSAVYVGYNYLSIVNQVENSEHPDFINDFGTTELSDMIVGVTYALIDYPTLYFFLEARADMRTKYQRDHSALFERLNKEGNNRRRDSITVGGRYSF